MPTAVSSRRSRRASCTPPTAVSCGTTTATRSSQGEAPATVHPSLWRQSQLVAKQGLYEVVEGIYQVRGLDLSNITFVEGDTGVIVIDPLISTETAAAALGAVPAAPRRTRRSSRSSTRTATSTTSAASSASPARPRSKPARCRSSRPRDSSSTPSPRTCTPARRCRGAPGYMYGAALARGPQGQVGAGLGQTTSSGEVGLIVPTARGHDDRRDAHGRRRRDRVPDGAGHRGAVGDALLLPAVPRALHGRERDPHAAQPAHAARRARARPARVVAVPDRGDRHVRRPHRRRLRLAPLADLDRRARRRVPLDAARPLRLPARPDPAPAQPGLPGRRDRRADRAAARARERVEHARLLRLGQPQRQGDLPALHGLVRRQPGAPLAAPAGRAGHALRRGARRHRPRRRARAGGLRRRRLPLGGDAARPRGLHRREPRARLASCSPTRSSSWATAPRTARGATSSSRARPSCATATSARRPRPPRRRSSPS